MHLLIELSPLHIVRKQEIAPYFASNRKEEHSKDCQHYQDFIPNRNLTKLINSNNIEDKNRLEFLVDSNLRSAINLLLKKDKNNKKTKRFKTINSTNKKTKDNTKTYKRESIPRISIKNLYKKKSSLLDNYIIIWGEAEIESKSYKDNSFKSLIFKQNGKLIFSIPLSKNLITYYTELPENPSKTGFSVFGLLQKNKTFINLKIRTTQHINYL